MKRILYNKKAHGEIPKWPKGPVSKTGRGESLRGFDSLFLRHKQLKPLAKGFFRVLVEKEGVGAALLRKLNSNFEGE